MSDADSGRAPVLVACAAAVLSAATYLQALGVGFYSDDLQWLARMPATAERPWFVFTVFYRDFNPLLHASFFLDYLLGHQSAWAFHLSSIIVHALNTALVAVLCARWTGSAVFALAAGGLWGVNVRLSEAVIWPAARGHALATLFVLLGLLALARRTAPRAAASTVSFCAALLSKEIALVPLLLAPWTIPRERRAWKIFLALGALAAAFAVFNVAAKPSFDTNSGGASVMALKLPFILLRPVGLGDLYDFSILGAAFCFGGLAIAGWLFDTQRVRLGLLWLLACAVPILALPKLSSRYVYLLSFGWVLLACGVLEWVRCCTMTKAFRRLSALTAGCAVVLLIAVNVVLVQREIEDYRVLSEPYRACLDLLRAPAQELEPGQTLVVADISPRDAIARLNRFVAERGTITKLIPERPQGVGGLVALDDAVNILRARERGIMAVRTTLAPDAPAARSAPTYIYDGARVRRASAAPDLPAERRLVVTLASSQAYFARSHADDGL
jgi:hypothetical protein